MAVTRDRPYLNSNFLIDFDSGDSRSVAMGFAEVIFPPFTLDDTGPRQDESKTIQAVGAAEKAGDNHIVLKRGFIGSLNLYNWWDRARHGKAPKRRTMKIELLAEDQSTVVVTWHFRNVRPVSLEYSPLRALGGEIVTETLVLAFDSMEMS